MESWSEFVTAVAAIIVAAKHSLQLCFGYCSQKIQYNKLIENLTKSVHGRVHSLSYGCTREVAKHERSVRVIQGDNQLKLLYP